MRSDTGWPSPESLGMNPIQFKAFKMALSNDCSIIHGPPGTGKTYVALKIVETMIKNIKTSEKPILVLSMTNHALDQFLVGILKITTNVTRVGGCSKVTDLDTIHNLRSKRRPNIHTKSLYNLTNVILKVENAIEVIKTYNTGPFDLNLSDLYYSVIYIHFIIYIYKYHTNI